MAESSTTLEEFLLDYLDATMPKTTAPPTMRDVIYEHAYIKDKPTVLEAFEKYYSQVQYKPDYSVRDTITDFTTWYGTIEISKAINAHVEDYCLELDEIIKKTEDYGILDFGDSARDVRNYPAVMERIREYAFNTYGAYLFDDDALCALTASFYQDNHDLLAQGKASIDYPSMENTLKSNREDAQIREIQEATALNGNRQYLVRGALLRCTCGSHYRMLQLPVDHGVYVRGKPQIFAQDASPGLKDSTANYHIGWFGHCTASGRQTDIKVRLTPYTPNDQEGRNLVAPAERTDSDYVCIPLLTTYNWESTEENAYIANSGYQNDCRQIVSMQSYITCRRGGLIYPLTSGQLEISSFTPPFIGCPFAVDLTEGSRFMKWCDGEGICPYMPGTSEYDKWYKNAIDALPVAELKERAKSNRKEIAKIEEKRDPLYEEWKAGMIQTGAYKGYANDEVRTSYYEGTPPYPFSKEVDDTLQEYASKNVVSKDE